MFKKNSSKVETIIKTGEEPQSTRLSGPDRLKECSLIVAVLASILLYVALLTFSPADPSWSQTAWGGDIANAGGMLGAWFADTLFFSFGSLAYTIPLLIVVTAWVCLRKRDEDDPLDLMLWGTRFLGFTILVLTSCALADINFDDIWYFSSGGVIGDVLTSIALPTLNALGTTLVLLFLWGAGFTLLTGISWLTIVDWLGHSAIKAFTRLFNRVRGEQDEVMEPQLKQVDDFDSVPVKPSAQVDVQESQEPPRRYNIHMPEAAIAAATSQAVAQAPSTQQESELAQPATIAAEAPIETYQTIPEPVEVVDVPQQSVFNQQTTPYHANNVTADETSQIERTRQLGATIEQLEQDATQADDMADQFIPPWQQDVAIAPETAAAIASTAALQYAENNQVEISPATSEVFDSSRLENSSLGQTSLEDSPLPNEAPWQQVETAATPEINQTQLDDITQNVEVSSSHIEPTISSFDVAEPIEDAQVSPVMSIDESAIPEAETQDQDVSAFQSIVADAQAKVVAKQNPFLVQQDLNLPKPTEPLPTLELLYHPEKRENFIDREALEGIARLVESKLADYKIQATVVDIFPGPVITRFELDLAPGVKVSRISSLSMDLARSLSAMAVRVVEVIPGKPYVGLELPNMSRQTVFFSDVVGSQTFIDAKSPTTVVLGQDIAGEAVIADIAKMPHVLVAGTTGSGKSVGVNVMILSMLYKASPEDLRFIMIDPKMLELSIYEGIPHLLSEVVTDMKDASNALRWCVGEMERRYKLMSALGVRNIKGFNDKLKMAADAGHPIHDPLWKPGDSMDEEAPLLEKLPYIVVVVDEFADLIMVVGKKVEELIARLAQKARAAGVHLILATQRPSVDVITGLIKANIPTRIAFTVSTKTDSRTILDQGGAESLLGMGDMLYLAPGSSHTERVHGAFASDDDVHAVVNNWKARGKPNYIEEIISGEQGPESLLPGESMEADEDTDPLFDQVVEHVVQSRRGSVSGVQRRFKIGYNRAARIVEQLEAQGIVSAPGHNGNREVLAPAPGRDMN
ncbi:DNA translocase ftsK [Vibrio ichthyoenteri ATCC 700023]|uniref:DNA translocase FtsK n=1 Tax=Vibrio ichthyoenteri ATCC 700023 TaxID=870968 RepID=F9RYB9_9VIBR|nr:DNA translocase FtsK [Vibrio ichthyoenteri]EGU46925.1 DNA translocase ftsK [Vibrio ichthyoenteri ATCC 700023]